MKLSSVMMRTTSHFNSCPNLGIMMLNVGPASDLDTIRRIPELISV
jgi:hypothetical protein